MTDEIKAAREFLEQRWEVFAVKHPQQIPEMRKHQETILKALDLAENKAVDVEGLKKVIATAWVTDNPSTFGEAMDNAAQHIYDHLAERGLLKYSQEQLTSDKVPSRVDTDTLIKSITENTRVPDNFTSTEYLRDAINYLSEQGYLQPPRKDIIDLAIWHLKQSRPHEALEVLESADRIGGGDE